MEDGESPQATSDKPVYENFSVVAGVSHPKGSNGLKKKSRKYRGEVAGRMQYAKYFYARASSSVEEKIALKSSNRHDNKPLEILTPKSGPE